jgi:hypothetical protein
MIFRKTKPTSTTTSGSTRPSVLLAFPRCSCTETAELAPAAGPACTVTDARHIGMASCLQHAWRFHLPNTQLSCAYWSEAATAVLSLQPWRLVARSRVGVPVPSFVLALRGPTEPCGCRAALHIVQYVKRGESEYAHGLAYVGLPRGADISQH